MGWMAETAARRASPQAMWPEARSAIVLGVPYTPESDPLEDLTRREEGVISVYARGRDYHDVIKKRLKALARFVAETYGAEVKVFVDTAPLMEKPLAARAGIGWQGKHTNLVSRDFGSWLFLGTVLTDLDLAPDAAGDRSLRLLPLLPRYLPDQSLPRALPARCPALHFLSDDRAQGPHPGRIPGSHRQPDLWLRRLPRRLSLEQIRQRGRGDQSRSGPCRTTSADPSPPRRSRASSTTRPSARSLPARRSSASAGIASSVTS